MLGRAVEAHDRCPHAVVLVMAIASRRYTRLTQGGTRAMRMLLERLNDICVQVMP